MGRGRRTRRPQPRADDRAAAPEPSTPYRADGMGEVRVQAPVEVDGVLRYDVVEVWSPGDPVDGGLEGPMWCEVGVSDLPAPPTAPYDDTSAGGIAVRWWQVGDDVRALGQDADGWFLAATGPVDIGTSTGFVSPSSSSTWSTCARRCPGRGSEALSLAWRA